MDADSKYNERHELVEIYNNLSLPLKRQLLMIARVIDSTMEITLSEKKKSNRKIDK